MLRAKSEATETLPEGKTNIVIEKLKADQAFPLNLATHKGIYYYLQSSELGNSQLR